MKRNLLILIIIVVIATFFYSFLNKSKDRIQVGDEVPTFTLLDQDGNDFLIDDYIGRKALVIYFYPKDNTTGCIKEACEFRDNYDAFEDIDVKIIGISSDDVISHKNFANKYNLPFTLLADVDNEVREKFGVPNSLFGVIPGRVTYVVDEKGIVIHIYESLVKAQRHIEEALDILESR